MTKKSTRKPNLSQAALDRARAELRGEATPVIEKGGGALSPTLSKAKVATRSTASQTIRRAPTLEELQREYTHVIRDLRSLLILSGVILVAIVVIAVVLPPVTG